MIKEKLEIQVCTQLRSGPNAVSCGNKGSALLLQQLQDYLHSQDIDIEAVATPCMLLCEHGPNMKLTKAGTRMGMHKQLWSHVTHEQFPSIIEFLKE